MKAPVRIAVTGAAGQIGYSLLFRIAAGDMLGREQPVILQLLELPLDKAQAALKGVMMELEDCAFPLLVGMQGSASSCAASDSAAAMRWPAGISRRRWRSSRRRLLRSWFMPRYGPWLSMKNPYLRTGSMESARIAGTKRWCAVATGNAPKKCFLHHVDACENDLEPGVQVGMPGGRRASRCEADLHTGLPLHPRGRN